ncbi:MAG: RNA polymerase sigma factor RpoD/SigA [Nanoarchaeota archaeon]
MRQLKISKQITNRESQSLNKYLTEVSSIADTISSEEEIELTRKIKEGDVNARNKLITANLRFVISVAKQYGGKSPLPDLINEGNIGLIKAAERFDETRGFKFISYAVWWIRQSIMQYLADHGRQIRLPLNKIGMVNKIKQAKSELEQILQRTPTISEISEHLSLKETDNPDGEVAKYDETKIKELLFNSGHISSLDAPLTDESDSGTLLETLNGDDEYNVKSILNNKDLQTELSRAMQTLKQREQEVLVLYFGLFGQTALSLEEIGERFDLTRERVRQIKEQAIRRIKSRAHRTRLKEYR